MDKKWVISGGALGILLIITGGLYFLVNSNKLPQGNVIVDSSNTPSINEVRAKAIIAGSLAGIHACILVKENKVLESKSNQPLCQGKGLNSQDIALWGDIEKVGGKWDGCDFQVTRNADGMVGDVQYCAILPSGIQAVCTLSRCSYGGD